MHYNKRIIYFKNIYKTDLCECLKETQKEHTYTVDGLINGGGLYPGGLISGIKWMGLYPGRLKTGVLKVEFYGNPLTVLN